MSRYIHTKHFFSILIPLLSAMVLVSCASYNSEVTREPVSPPVDKKFALEGHIEKQEVLKDKQSKPSEIPDLVSKRAILPPKPNFQNSLKKYSVSAINIPLSELLLKLAQDSGKQLDLHSGVDGAVTINAVNQDLPTILKRISVQLGFLYEVTPTSIVVRPDKPYWHNYSIDYVNIQKVSQDTIDMKMSVGGSSGIGTNVGTGGSASNIKVVSEHNFWDSVEQNLARIVKSGLGKSSGGKQAAPVAAAGGKRARIVNNNIVVNPEAGVISIFATGAEHRAVKTYLDDIMSRAEKQVMIEATVVEVELSDQYQAGIDWSTLVKSDSGNGVFSQNLITTTLSSTASTSFNFTGIGGDWDLGIRMLQQFGNTKVLSSPKIMAVNNQTALLKVVNNEVYFTIEVNRESATTTSAGTTTYETTVHTVPVGFMMSVTPFVSDDDNVSLNIRPTISRIVGYVNDPSPDLAKEDIISRIPVIQEREMASVLKLKNQQTAVIGGLIEDSNTNDKTAVPWANELPVVGDLFSYKDDVAKKSELVIFIRPIVVKNPDVDHGDLTSLRNFLKTDHN
ncbi:pilus (MSHA type) biogenesis protein MshL [Thiomicrorhabdus sp. ZW0627]|uniref:pilus (MSHA type) biogenesis protein MshL n=1 Tax=Thiomicrorhabdus sp. ZW0627 TaxID=3039774 RepID=UPI0024374494|nr:pilus (MSHA type) biogenesis protein MshL [Thiomicrorhabdus sp. ZW0627]MDG6773937.1 pilus (MSHA type) biogenesis protein MshL [Thiomicrorhabdus sp. ZW0627]